jgi:hypothetical protein
MNTTQLYKLAGAIGIVGSILNVIADLLPSSSGQPLNLFANLCVAWVLVALYLYQRQESGLLGLIGYGVNSFGFALIVSFLFVQTFVFPAVDSVLVQQLNAGTFGLVVLSSVAILAVGVVLFGVATFRAKVFPRWAAILYILGFLVSLTAPFVPRLVGFAAEVAISASVAGLCYTLLTMDKRLLVQGSE